MGEPTKAYLVTVKFVNECDAVVYATSAADALHRFEYPGDDISTDVSFNGRDYRIGRPKVKRLASEDR